MKHRHRKEKKRFVVIPTMMEIHLFGVRAATKYFIACRCGAIFHENEWIDDSELILEITGQHKFIVARTMVPYEKLTWKD